MSALACEVPPPQIVHGETRVGWEVEHFALPNGLEALLHRDPSVQDVVVRLQYHVGHKDDLRGKQGLAHLVEHAMFRGSNHSQGKTYSQTLRGFAELSVNGTTTEDDTTYITHIAGNNLPLVLWAESDRMASQLAAVSDEAFELERKIVLNEHRERVSDRPGGAAACVLEELLFSEGHPYGHDGDGPCESEASLRAITKEDARTFVSMNYVPANATLTIVGNFDLQAARKGIADYFAAIPSGVRPRAKSTMWGPLPLPLTKHMRARLPRAQVRMGWRIPALGSPLDAVIQFADDTFPLMIRDRLLQKQVAVAASMDCTQRLLGGYCSIAVDLAPGVDPEDVQKEVGYAMGQMEEQMRYRLIDAKLFAVMHHARRLDSLHERAALLETSLQTTGRWDNAVARLQDLERVSLPDLVSLTSGYLRIEHAATVIVHPDAAAPVAGEVIP
jgi:zinc protease